MARNMLNYSQNPLPFKAGLVRRLFKIEYMYIIQTLLHIKMSHSIDIVGDLLIMLKKANTT